MHRYEARSEITGSVWKVLKKLGEAVTAGDELVIIESMKMEIPLIAEEDGTVVEVCFEEGSPVAEGDTVVIIER